MNSSLSIGAILGNFLVLPFQVSKPDLFLEDSVDGRGQVAIQYGIIYLFNLAVLFGLPLMPSGKVEIHRLKKTANSSTTFAVLLAATVCLFITLSLLNSFLLYRFIE